MKQLALLVFLLSGISHASLVVTTPPMVSRGDSVMARELKTQQNIQNMSTLEFRSLKSTVEASFLQIWKNPLALTPQQSMDALGADACSAHMMFLGIAQILNVASPGSFTLSEPCQVSCNPDGTVVVGKCSQEKSP